MLPIGTVSTKFGINRRQFLKAAPYVTGVATAVVIFRPGIFDSAKITLQEPTGLFKRIKTNIHPKYQGDGIRIAMVETGFSREGEINLNALEKHAKTDNRAARHAALDTVVAAKVAPKSTIYAYNLADQTMRPFPIVNDVDRLKKDLTQAMTKSLCEVYADFANLFNNIAKNTPQNEKPHIISIAMGYTPLHIANNWLDRLEESAAGKKLSEDDSICGKDPTQRFNKMLMLLASATDPNNPQISVAKKRFDDAVETLAKQKISVCISACNDGDRYPDATYNRQWAETSFLTHNPSIIVVGALGKTATEVAPYSNMGNTTVCVPGTFNINLNTNAMVHKYGEYEYTGTSGATAFMAGLCALALQANPKLGPTDLKNALQKSAIGIAGKPEATGKGCIQPEPFIRKAETTTAA